MSLNSIKFSRNTGATRTTIEDADTGYVGDYPASAYLHSYNEDQILISLSPNPKNDRDGYLLDWKRVNYAGSSPQFATTEYDTQRNFIVALRSAFFSKT